MSTFSTIQKEEVISQLELNRDVYGLNKLQQEQLFSFLELLFRWNAVHNLTAIRDPVEMVGRHLWDSLTLLPFLKGTRILDVGTGAGLPGIPLCIARPDLSFVLIDSNTKKLNFVDHVIATLGLKSVKAVHIRVQDYGGVFDCVLSRAFSSLRGFVESSGHLCQKNGTLIAMKGPISEVELAGLPDGYTIESIEPVCVPNVSAKRFLVLIRKG